jgi:phenylalanyl-tRNA synthetase beta chain
MPTIEVSLNDISGLLGRKVDAADLDDLILFAKGELDGVDGDTVKLDMKDTNRPDLWSTEGIVRQLKGNLGIEGGLPNYEVIESEIQVYADPRLRDVRPYCLNTVIMGLEIDEAFLSQIIQLQEKIALTFGRKRKEVAVGIIDFDKITPPIYYKATRPDENAFVPLTFSREMTPREILMEHPKGQEYGHLVGGSEVYPLLIDSQGIVLTMPPIINSENTGKVSTDTKNVFIDITGHDIEYMKIALNVIVTAFADRGGKIYGVTVNYGDDRIKVPDLTSVSYTFSKRSVLDILGIDIDDDLLLDHLSRMRYGATVKGDEVTVHYLPYRKDIMHPYDVLEDIAISFGYNDIEPEIPKLYTIGRLEPVSVKLRGVRELVVGMGFQEVLTFTLSNEENLYKRMNIPRPDKVVEIENPVSQSWSVLRDWITPSLVYFLSRNTHHDYPQNIFEVSEVVTEDNTKETRVDNRYRLALAMCNSNANYTAIRECLDSFLCNIGKSATIVPHDHGSFIDGRAGRIVIDGLECGLIGELHPQVLENWGIENPIAVAELEIERLLQ